MTETEEEARPRRGLSWVVLVVVFIVGYAWMTRGTVSPFIDEVAPPLSLAVAAGGEPGEPRRVTLAEMQDEVVVLEFWASWCGACRRTTPILNDLRDEFANDAVAFYAVNVEAIDRQRLQAAHTAFGARFPSLHDRTGEVQRRYAIKALPTVIVVDRTGVVRWASTGVPSKMRLRGAISEALN